jgi:hypothetical protein
METVLLDDPWILLCLLYVGGWFIVFLCANPRDSPPTQDGSPAAPTATEKARANVRE